MPNHVTNRLEIIGSNEQVNSVLEAIKGIDACHFIDFEKIIPSPSNMFNENITMEQKEQCREQGIPTWIDWCPANWGTKWNSYENELIENVIKFKTAWNGVERIADKLASMFPNVCFKYQYASEDTGYCVGNIIYEKGEKWKEDILVGTNRAYDLCFELNLGKREYYHKVEGCWECIDDE